MACTQVNTISRHPNCPVLGAMCQMQSIHSSPRRTPAAYTAVPGGWIDLTREGFCYAHIVGILSFSGVAQSLVNWPYELPLGGQGHQAGAMPQDERVGKHHQRFDVLLGHPGEGTLEVARFAYLHAVERHPPRLSRLLERLPRLALDGPEGRHREHTHTGGLGN